jgi:putative protease
MKPELLAPAGDPEKLLFAYLYGADAAYIGGGAYSLRQNSGFNLDEIADGVKLAHDMGKKLYVAVNFFMRNRDIEDISAYLTQLAEIRPDALIISDPGVFSLAKKNAADLPLHISTQANNTNWPAARFWWDQGASRIILARELTLTEAAEISQKCPIETEVFIHGAMCIAYSGRCLLSSFMTHRSANQGDCSHPCRYHYALREAKRPDELFPIAEDHHGSYIMNSKDLCLLDDIPRLCDGRFSALKIEGRNKSAYYVANAVRVYRAAIDAYHAEGDEYYCRDAWHAELAKISHRQYTRAFADGPAEASAMRYDDGGYIRNYDFCAIIRKKRHGMLVLEQRNHIGIGDKLEIIFPDGSNAFFSAEHIYDQEGIPLQAARHPRELISIPYPFTREIKPPLIVRRPVK